MDAIDDHIEAGRRHGVAVLTARAAEYGPDNMAAFAGGMAAGVRNYVIATLGRTAASKLFAGLADDALKPHEPIDFTAAKAAGRSH
jgi:hypothetical protein